MHILAPLEYDGTETEFYQSQGSEQSSRTSPHHDNLRTAFHIRVVRPHVFVIMGLFVDIYAHLQIHVYLSLARVDAPFQDPHAPDRPYVNAMFVSQISFQPILLCRNFRHYPYLILVCHNRLEGQVVGTASLTGRLLCWWERSRSTISWWEGRSLRRSSCRSYLTTNHIIGANIVKPASIKLMGINIKLHGKIFTLLDIVLFDTVFTEDTEKTFLGVLSWNLYDIILRHPVVSRTCRHTTLGRQHCNNFTC